MKLSRLLALITILASFSLSVHANLDEKQFPKSWGTNDVSTSLQCKVKTVVVLAQSEADCKAIGGEPAPKN